MANPNRSRNTRTILSGGKQNTGRETDHEAAGGPEVGIQADLGQAAQLRGAVPAVAAVRQQAQLVLVDGVHHEPDALQDLAQVGEPICVRGASVRGRVCKRWG